MLVVLALSRSPLAWLLLVHLSHRTSAPRGIWRFPGDTSGFDTTDCSPLDVAAADYSLDVDAIT